MSNVLSFKKPIAMMQSGNRPTWREAIAALELMPTHVSEIRNAQTQLKEDIRVTVLMLDLAVTRARRLAEETDDARAKRDLDDHLAVIEDLLEIARQKAKAL
jgi:hypothetical protein